MKKYTDQIFIFGVWLIGAIVVAYFLGKTGFGSFMFESVKSDFISKLLLLIWIDMAVLTIGGIYFLVNKNKRNLKK